MRTELIVRPCDDDNYSEQSRWEYSDLLRRYNQDVYKEISTPLFRYLHQDVVDKLGFCAFFMPTLQNNR